MKNITRLLLIFSLEVMMNRSDLLISLFNSFEGMISLNEMLLLYKYASQVKHGCIVEVGSYRGKSTVALSYGSMDGFSVPVYAIEPHEEFTGFYGGTFSCEDRRVFYETMISSQSYKNVRLINLSSENISFANKEPVSLLWLDGDHSYAGVKKDFKCWERFLGKESIIIFHDSIDVDCGPYLLISEILTNKEYKVIEKVDLITVLKKCHD